MVMAIQRLSPDSAKELIPNLADLLQDAVLSGASIGFLLPFTHEDAIKYWEEVITALEGPNRILLVAHEDQAVFGSVQLEMASRPNGSHRAEIVKLMVHTAYRGRGIGQTLMEAIQEEADRLGRTTLILDTREGDPSERLYSKLGFTRAGIIPEYARSTNGTLHPTAIMYKLLRHK
jgi:acetyltransferase